MVVTSGEQTLTESTPAQATAGISPESNPELMSRLLQEAREQMRIQAEQAEQQRADFKHQIGEKTKEVVAAKKEVEKATKKAKKSATTKKTLMEAERRAEMKGLARRQDSWDPRFQPRR